MVLEGFLIHGGWPPPDLASIGLLLMVIGGIALVVLFTLYLVRLHLERLRLLEKCNELSRRQLEADIQAHRERWQEEEERGE